MTCTFPTKEVRIKPGMLQDAPVAEIGKWIWTICAGIVQIANVTPWLLRGVVLLRAGVEPSAVRAGYLGHQRFEVYRANVAQMVSELGWELPSGEW
jgi:hypothetical protein